MQLDAPESPESSDMQEIHSLGVYQSSDTQISKSDMKTITGSSYHVSKNIFLWEKGLHRRFVSSTGGVDVPITNGSKYEPAVMGAHQQRLAHASLPVYEPAVMNPAICHHRLKSNGTQNRW